MRVVENDSQVSCLTCLGDDVATDGNEEVCRRDRFGGEGDYLSFVFQII